MADLVPPDLTRCQSEYRRGSFMTLGPRSLIRCENKPHWIATESKAGFDGRKGSMAVCDSCAEVLLKQRQDIDLEWIT